MLKRKKKFFYVKIENTMREFRYHLPVKADRVRIAGFFHTIGKRYLQDVLLFTCSTDNNELKKNQFAHTILVGWQFSSKTLENIFNHKNSLLIVKILQVIIII